MKKIVLAFLLLSLVVPVTSAQNVIQYRRPMRALGIEVAAGMSTVLNENRALGGIQQGPVHIAPIGGITFEGPMNYSLDIVLKAKYNNKSFIGNPAVDNPIAAHNIHSAQLDMGVNWYPFHNIFYMGAYFIFGGNFLIHRIDADGSQTKLKASDLDALGLFLSYGLEAGFSFGFWPIGDHVAIFARWEQDFMGAPFNKQYREGNGGINKKMRMGVVSAGVRIPIILIRD